MHRILIKYKAKCMLFIIYYQSWMIEKIAALAGRYAWDLYKRYDDENFIRIIRDDMIEDIAMENSDFYDIYKAKEIKEDQSSRSTR